MYGDGRGAMAVHLSAECNNHRALVFTIFLTNGRNFRFCSVVSVGRAAILHSCIIERLGRCAG